MGKLKIALAVVVVVVLVLSEEVLGQVGSNASILGVVTDQTPGVLPGAIVEVVNLETGLKRTTSANSAGFFEIPALPVGPYSVTVSHPGFKSWKLSRLVLSVGDIQRISPILQLGDVADQVTVESTSELIETERSSVGSVVNQKQMRDLPLNGRNPVQLVTLAPGMRFVSGSARQSTVQGSGARDDQTEFQVDGLNANDGLDERGMAIPNVDTIAEFRVETNSFSAELGRHPLQVLMLTKSGTNEFHGTLWEFLRNEKLDAFNTFAKVPGARKPKLARNQFGAAIGGPIIKNKTFFFGSFGGTTIRQGRIYNSVVVNPAMLRGDFSSLSRSIRDPLTGQPFPGNQIPESRFSSASKFFFPYILLPNSPDGRFRSTAPIPSDAYEGVGKIDQQITDKQKISGRWIVYDETMQVLGYSPDVVRTNNHRQHNVGLNYTYTISPTTLLTTGGNYVNWFNRFKSPVVGIENLTEKAGIAGFPTAGREGSTGLPQVGFVGYTGFNPPGSVPGSLWTEQKNAKATMHLIRSLHTINFGYEINDRSAFGRHAGNAPNGNFSFNGQYTGDGFADYLLGYVAVAFRAYPLQTFGMKHSPYSALYIQDSWKVSPRLTINAGLRYDHWHEKRAVRGNVTSFDPTTGKAVAGEDKNGQVDLTAQPVARFLAKATEGLWVPASQIGAPAGLFEGQGYWSPRLGVAWRPLQKGELVIRGGYGIFPTNFVGNMTASAIVGPPFWNWEQVAFTAASLQRWETTFSSDPSVFAPSSFGAPSHSIRSQKAHEWNFSVQAPMPLRSALTVSYVGNRVLNVIAANPRNEVAPGLYTNLQAARSYPRFGDISLYENTGRTWYNGLHVKWERRFSQGLLLNSAYAWGKHLLDGVGTIVWDAAEPFAPKGYNRGRSSFDRTHILTTGVVYELPLGKGRRYLGSINPLANGILGGWQVSTIYNFTSGAPLSLLVPGATLGNGRGTRANLLRSPELSNPSADLWFDPSAFGAPPLFQFGNSGLGVLDGPAGHVLDLGLMKNFYITENRYIQFRWEMFNAPNHVNLGSPVTTFGIAPTGRIFSAGDARQMQFGLKFIF